MGKQTLTEVKQLALDTASYFWSLTLGFLPASTVICLQSAPNSMSSVTLVTKCDGLSLELFLTNFRFGSFFLKFLPFLAYIHWFSSDGLCSFWAVSFNPTGFSCHTLWVVLPLTTIITWRWELLFKFSLEMETIASNFVFQYLVSKYLCVCVCVF